MRTFFIVIGVLVVFLFLATNNVLTGQVCVKGLGCLSSGAGGLHVDSSTAPQPTSPVGP